MDSQTAKKSDISSFYSSNVLFVLVLYNSPLSESEAFLSLDGALGLLGDETVVDMVVYDNSPSPVFDDSIKFKRWNITYIHDDSNPGLSKASNEGAKIAFELKKEWIIFMNPDTGFSQDFLAKTYSAIIENGSIYLFVPILLSNSLIVSPSKFILNRGSVISKIELGVNDFNRKSVLYSGMVISSEAFKKCGGFNNNIKLDFMDFYFVERYKKLYSNFFLIDSYCTHDLSSFEQDKAKVLRRFMYYCEGARNYSESLVDYLSLLIWGLIRSIKFCFKFKDISFLLVFFKYFAFSGKQDVKAQLEIS